MRLSRCVRAPYQNPDTQCPKDGDQVDQRTIVPLLRVYVVATRDAQRELVADQVILGAVREPHI